MPRIALALLLALPLTGCGKRAPADNPTNGSIVRVRVTYIGATSEEVDAQVALLLVRQLEGLKGVARVECESKAGACAVTVRFAAEGIEAADRVRDAVSAAVPNLPDGIDAPQVERLGTTATWFALRYDQSNDAKINTVIATMAAKRARDELLRTPGVSGVEIVGGADFEKWIYIDPERLAARALTIGEVASAIETARFFDPQRPPIEDVVVKKVREAEVRVRDVATFDPKGTRQERTVTRDGKPVVLFGVHRSDGEKVELPKLQAAVAATPTDPPPRLALTGPDVAKLRAWADAVLKSGAIENAEVRPGPNARAVHLKLDREKMAKFNLSAKLVALQLDDLSGRPYRDDEFIRLVVPGEESPANPGGRLKRKLRAGEGVVIELGAIASVEVRDEPPAILRVGAARAVHVAGKQAGGAVEAADAERKRLGLGDEYKAVAW